jgi:hypothetical protein
MEGILILMGTRTLTPSLSLTRVLTRILQALPPHKPIYIALTRTHIPTARFLFMTPVQSSARSPSRVIRTRILLIYLPMEVIHTLMATTLIPSLIQPPAWVIRIRMQIITIIPALSQCLTRTRTLRHRQSIPMVMTILITDHLPALISDLSLSLSHPLIIPTV